MRQNRKQMPLEATEETGTHMVIDSVPDLLRSSDEVNKHLQRVIGLSMHQQ
jgi:hypothetical protein